MSKVDFQSPAKTKITIKPAADNGNIIVVDATNPQNIQLKIREDYRVSAAPQPKRTFLQWFNFELTASKNEECVLRILNASEVSYPEWHQPTSEVPYQPFAYQTVASYDGQDWFRVNTEYNGKELIMKLKLEHEHVQFAYFAPYSYQQHLELIETMQKSALCQIMSLGKTTEHRDITLLTLGEPAPRKLPFWIIARQHPGESMAEWFVEGLLKNLLDKNNVVAQKLLENVVIYCVPNMNPDGTFHGNLRTNAMGIDLNREWTAPNLKLSPEVYVVRQAMRQTGVAFFMDVHGDEAIPYVFLEKGSAVIKDPKTALLEEQFMQSFKKANKHYQTQYNYGYDMELNDFVTLAYGDVAQEFGCPSFTLEMPFKDDANHPNPHTGWSPKLTMELAASMLSPLYETALQLIE